MDGFYGEYRHIMDAKGRVSLPAKFRKVLPESLVVVPSPNKEFLSLNVFTEEGFSIWKEAIFNRDGGYQADNIQHVELRMKYNSSAMQVDVDSAGRINIPPELREHASLAKNVVIVGDEDHICVWDELTWDEYKSHLKSKSIFTRE